MWHNPGRWTIGSSALLVATASTLWSQQPGAIRGTVVDGQSHDALANASIKLQGTTLSTLSSPEGAFALTGVPSGTHTVVATSIGYRPVTVSVAVRPGETTTLALELQPAPSTLTELVVTAEQGTDRDPRCPRAGRSRLERDDRAERRKDLDAGGPKHDRCHRRFVR